MKSLKSAVVLGLCFSMLALLTGCPENSVSDPSLLLPDNYAQDAKDALGDTQDDLVGPGPCLDNKDCPEGLLCHPDRRVCLECWDSAQCGEDEACIDEACAKRPPCTKDTDCPDELHCNTGQGSCFPCVTRDHCDEGYLCEEGECTPENPTCGVEKLCPEGMVCLEDGTCVPCTSDAACALDSWCDLGAGGRCRLDACAPGAAVCVGNFVLVCVANGSGWGTPTDCPEASTCKDGACIPDGGCEPGLSYCANDNTRRVCAESGLAWNDIPCPDGEHCEAGTFGAICRPLACEPDCSAVPQGFCGLDSLCGLLCDHCVDGGNCSDAAFAPGQPLACVGPCSCEGKACGTDGCGQSCGTCAQGYRCELGQCLLDCVPDCYGKQCGSDGCEGSCGVCDSNSTCTQAGVCLPKTCEPGVLACDGNNRVVCAEDGFTWIGLGPCVNGKYCSGGICVNQACTPGLRQCQGNNWRECAGDGSGWLPAQACPQGTTCLEGVCLQENVCEGIPAVGCCNGDIATWCGPDGVSMKFCGVAGCGWLGSAYECGGYGPDPSGQNPLYCPGTCEPLCDGKECGLDGCGGTCGACAPGDLCQDGNCETVCVPQCSGKGCGPDGCGGSCGTCPSDRYCATNTGTCMDRPSCEEISSCVMDTCYFDGAIPSQECLARCSLGATNTEMNDATNLALCVFEACAFVNMPFDLCFQQVIGEGECHQLWISCVNCNAQCKGRTCGPDGCNGLCGKCGSGQACEDGNCKTICVPQCANVQCGDNGCGGSCGTCKPGEECLGGLCQGVCIPFCGQHDCGGDGCGGSCGECDGDAICNGGFCEPVCLPECGGRVCGDNNCGGQCGFCQEGTACIDGRCLEQLACTAVVDCALACTKGDTACLNSCRARAATTALQLFDSLYGCVQEYCGQTPGKTCFKNALKGGCKNLYYECVDCQAQCENALCGPDGCGGECGFCSDGTQCIDSVCQEICVPQCSNSQCGDDGCGGSCGTCPKGYDCLNGRCREICIPQCFGRQCGSDGCGGQCGTCPAGYSCNATGQCSQVCVPQCFTSGGAKKQCGSDGCGGICGTCAVGFTCNASGQCTQTCKPNCTGKACGTDGCGGSCGTCPNGKVCDANQQCVQTCVPFCGGNLCGPNGCGGICGQCLPDEACVLGQCEAAWDCSNLMNCLWECGDNDQSCYDVCWSKASPEAKEQYVDLWECVVEVCGQDPQDSCTNKAIFQGPCGVYYKACMNCTPACTGKQCGSDNCGGSCGICPTGSQCDAFGYCVCQPNCKGKVCGSDGCGGVCGSCAPPTLCSQFGTCVCVPSCSGKSCGPDGCGGSCGTCKPGFTCSPKGACVSSGPRCGDQVCQLENNENCATCQLDCGECGGPCCEVHDQPGCEDPNIAKCVCDKDPECCLRYWDDYCVSLVTMAGCGECQCEPSCVSADGTFKQCGEDGCGGSCGSCPSNSFCDETGMCICQPSCAGKACGTDGCGGSCGTCKPNQICSKNQCLNVCNPQCTNPNGTPKQCGPDGCGGTCGTCGVGLTCNSSGACVCVPNCTGKQCGPNGCGGTCGSCSGFETCTASGQCKLVTPFCGDGSCTSFLLENCDTCPSDCGKCCGNKKCDSGFLEDCMTCATDCGKCCGDGFCKPIHGETCATCAADCGVCPPVCGDGVCAPNGLEDCSTCAADCGECEPFCGDFECQAWIGETCETCNFDCGDCQPYCGDQQCTPDTGETCQNCSQDCGQCDGNCCQSHPSPGCDSEEINYLVCERLPWCCFKEWSDECVALATETGRACTGDCCQPHEGYGCNDPEQTACVCQQFPECCLGFWSEDCVGLLQELGCGQCCIPNCAGKQCGPNGCGGSCGTCQPGYSCSNSGKCVVGGTSCLDILKCSAACGYTYNCMVGCSEKGSAAAKTIFNSLFVCAVQTCGIYLTPTCIQTAFKGKCVSQYQSCSAN